MSPEQQKLDHNVTSPELVALNAVVNALRSLSDDARERVINAALMLLGASPLSGTSTRQQRESTKDEITSRQSEEEQNSKTSDKLTVTDIRTLKEEKNPNTAIEMATLVAYYLSEIAKEDERKDTIESDDIRKYFRLAGFRLPANPPHQTLKFAKNAGYLDATARGMYRLNPVGYNLIVHGLPNKDSSKSSSRRKKKPTKNAPKKQGVKKASKKK